VKAVIIVPCYNSAATIKETFDSIASQTRLDRIEAVYLVDDASGDDSAGIAAAAWANQQTPLVVSRNEVNLGERTSVNGVFAQIGDKADWVFIFHSDDIAKPHWLETMLERIDRCPENTGSVCSSWDDWFPGDRTVPGEDLPSRPATVITGARAARDTFFKGCWWHVSGCAIRMKAFREIGGFKPDMPQLGDLEWLIRVLKTGWAVDYVARTLILYRCHAGNVSSASFRTNRDIDEFLKVLRIHGDVLSPRESARLKARLAARALRRLAKGALLLDPGRVRASLQSLLKIPLK